MSNFHLFCPSCSARLGSAVPVPAGRPLKCPRCGGLFTAPAGGAGAGGDARLPGVRSVAARDRLLTPLLWVLIVLGLLVLLGSALAVARSGKGHEAADVSGPPAPAPAAAPPRAEPVPLVVPVPVVVPVPWPAPAPNERPAPPPTPARRQPTEDKVRPKELILGSWKVTVKVTRRETATFLVAFHKDGSLSATIVDAPSDPDFQEYLGLRLNGTYTFRSEDVMDLDFTDLPGVGEAGFGTCKVTFLDRDLMILTNLATDKKTEWRRVGRE
jgi:hypothetical protein